MLVHAGKFAISPFQLTGGRPPRHWSGRKPLAFAETVQRKVSDIVPNAQLPHNELAEPG